MKTSENKEKKQLRELSEEELKEVTGGSSIDCSLPENKDKIQCSNKFERQTETQGGNWREISLDPHSIALSFGDDHLEIN